MDRYNGYYNYLPFAQDHWEITLRKLEKHEDNKLEKVILYNNEGIMHKTSRTYAVGGCVFFDACKKTFSFLKYFRLFDRFSREL